jgi:hypothetical protein
MKLTVTHLRILLCICGIGFLLHALVLWARLGDLWGRVYLPEYPAYCFSLTVFSIHSLLSFWLFLATIRARMTRVITISGVVQAWLFLMSLSFIMVASLPSYMNYAAVTLTVDPDITTTTNGILTVQTLIPAVICGSMCIIIWYVKRQVTLQLVDDIQIVSKHPSDRCGIAFSTALLLAIICGQLARNFYIYRTSPEFAADMMAYNNAISLYNQEWKPLAIECTSLDMAPQQLIQFNQPMLTMPGTYMLHDATITHHSYHTLVSVHGLQALRT